MLLGCERVHCPCTPEYSKIEVVRIDVENLARLGKDNVPTCGPVELFAIDALIMEHEAEMLWDASTKRRGRHVRHKEDGPAFREPERSHADACRPLQRSRNTQSQTLREAVMWSGRDFAAQGPGCLSSKQHRVFKTPLDAPLLAIDTITEVSEEEEDSSMDTILHAEECRHAVEFVRHLDQQQQLAHGTQDAVKETREEIKLSSFLTANGFTHVNARRTRMLRWKYPLHTAVKQRDAELVELLLKAKADPTLKNSAGVTPMQLAQKSNRNGSHTAVLRACPPVTARTPTLREPMI